MRLSRRRFLTISAVAATLPGALAARPSSQWIGQALGARASIRLDHPQAGAITARCLAEIDRLEDILSLYRADSALSRLNREGRLSAPPFELLDCLAQAGAVHHASEGRFDVTVQPLWTLWADAATVGRRPTAEQREAARAMTGWQGLHLSPRAITLRSGMALTLNGIGQGYVADRIAALLEAEGLSDILIDTGEVHAIGGRPDGTDWRVGTASGHVVPLRGRAMATSAPLGTTFDAAGRDAHILDPRSGAPAASVWKEISISAPTAALADALTTAACLMSDRAEIDALLAHFAGTRLEEAVPA